MVITEKNMYNYYLEDKEVALTRAKKKCKKNNHKSNKFNKFKSIIFVILLFFLGLMLIYQHSKINNINNEIIDLEQELKEVTMLNDSKEGELLANLNLDEIEQIAENRLGMVKPSTNQYTYLVVNNNELITRDDINTASETGIKDNMIVGWFARLID